MTMNEGDWARKVAEFPFLDSIKKTEILTCCTIKNVLVKKGDRNLLEITPHFTPHYEDGIFWSSSRQVYIVRAGEDPQVLDCQRSNGKTVKNIGFQILQKKVQNNLTYVVEVCGKVNAEITIYKMQQFDWSGFELTHQIRSSRS